MFDFEALIHAMPRQTVLCVGDLMLDEFVYGEVSRISPEAPAPVIAVQRSETSIGGAGNVARNIASLGARCIFVGLIGEDGAAAQLKAALAKEGRIESVLVCDAARPTTRKVRFVSEHFSTHMLRADWELAQPAASDIEQKLIDAILPQLARADIVLLSDYAKGVLTARVIRNVIDAARKLGKRVIVDPKSANFAIYRGATLLTPNRKEFAEAGTASSQSARSMWVEKCSETKRTFRVVGRAGSHTSTASIRSSCASAAFSFLPESSSPIRPTKMQRAPREAILRATLPAPPILVSLRCTAMTGAGASGEIRDTSP